MAYLLYPPACIPRVYELLPQMMLSGSISSGTKATRTELLTLSFYRFYF